MGSGAIDQDYLAPMVHEKSVAAAEAMLGWRAG
jgi:hypothetical protein